MSPKLFCQRCRKAWTAAVDAAVDAEYERIGRELASFWWGGAR